MGMAGRERQIMMVKRLAEKIYVVTTTGTERIKRKLEEIASLNLADLMG